MFIGRTDTTAATREWLMAELMKNPRIRKKAQEEIRRVVGKKAKITQADINQMEYLKLYCEREYETSCFCNDA